MVVVPHDKHFGINHLCNKYHEISECFSINFENIDKTINREGVPVHNSLLKKI